MSVTASFVALFGVAGLLLTTAGGLIIAALPWLSVAGGDRLALFGSSLTLVRNIGRYLEPAGVVLLLMSGAYVIYYWLTIGGLLG